MHFSDCRRNRIGLEIGNEHRAVGVCIDFSTYVLIGFRSAVCHLCQRALVPLLCNDRGPNATAIYLRLGKAGKGLITFYKVFFNITFNFEFYPMS